MPDRESGYALEGTLAHAYCAMKLKSFLKQDTAAEEKEIAGLYENYHTGEMDEYTDVYKIIVLEKLTAAMTARNMPLDAYEQYLDTRRFGTVPHSGFGLGFDRMLMYVTGVGNIRDTLLFPRTVGTL